GRLRCPPWSWPCHGAGVRRAVLVRASISSWEATACGGSGPSLPWKWSDKQCHSVVEMPDHLSARLQGFTVDLPLHLDRGGDEPLAHQLVAQIRSAVRRGHLPSSARLPSTRTLARELRVSRGVVLAT